MYEYRSGLGSEMKGVAVGNERGRAECKMSQFDFRVLAADWILRLVGDAA